MLNNKSTKAEIQAYLDSIGIKYSDDATKAELLELVPVPVPKLNEADQVEEVIESEVVEDIPDVELEEVDVDEVPDLPVATEKPKQEIKEPMRFTKWQLVYQSSFTPQQKDIFKLALEDDVPYTLEEVWVLVDEFIESLWW